ncbi:restriction endonuclease [Streptomyces thinghirensis]|nr:restriction endonuclease [Streptomyces thinghirensis]
MTVPERRIRPRRPGRRFDLRATAMLFGLAAVGLSVVGWVVRMALDVAERRPHGPSSWCSGSGGRHRLLAQESRLSPEESGARRATGALEEATATALDALETPTAAPAQEAHGVEESATEAVVDHERLSPDEFEQAIADLCVRDGCAEVEVVGGAGDLGADVVAVAPDGRRVVIQCKRYDDENKVGSQDLQRFGGTCFTVHEADVAVVVTSSDFTAPAVEYAEQCGILCVNESRLRNWSEGWGRRRGLRGDLVEEEAEPADRYSW